MRVAPRVAVLLSLLLCVACGGPELEFADWVEPVPAEGVEIFEYAGVPYDERAGREIEMVDDLVLGDPADPQQTFYQASSVETDAHGNIFVLDGGNHRVQVFDAQGNHLRSLGREGQGPGEFALPGGLVVTDEHMMLRADSRRLSTWTLDGEHIRDAQVAHILIGVNSTDAGFVARYGVRPEPASPSDVPARVLTYAAFDVQGETVEEYQTLDEPPPMVLEFGGNSIMFPGAGLISNWAPRIAASRDGRMYLTVSREYQVRAYGDPNWALRVAWPREEVTQEHIDITVEGIFSDGPLADLDSSQLEWGDRFNAIVGLEVDGHGHVYVFPFHLPLNAPIAEGEDRPEILHPVDVYSAAGEHLFSGLIERTNWSGARGDFVYAMRTNEDTDEQEVVRYRLVEPF